MKISRRNALARIGALAGTTAALGMSSPFKTPVKGVKKSDLNGRVRHSVCRWPYNDIPLDELCQASVEIGLESVEIVGPDGWPTLKEYGLDCAMPRAGDLGTGRGFCDLQYHDELVENFTESIPLVAEAGYDIVIVFSGNQDGIDDETGLQNCVTGVNRILSLAEEHNVTLCMELLNSKRDHVGYLLDRTEKGVDLCDRIGSDNFKLLYDIYHMQIMEGDVIQTIRDYHEYIAHYHTGGVPGRNELDETQELYWPAIMEAILETGYEGFVGQEFIPTWDDPIEALRHGVEVCDV